MSRSVHLSVSGMTCGHCTEAVRRALDGVDGVTDVTVDLQAGSATATVAPELATQTLIGAVEGAGYSAEEHSTS